MNLYHPNGYINIPEILNMDYPFIFILGARGTGKTYGALQYMIDHSHYFMLMRRMQAHADVLYQPDFNPFAQLNKDRKWDIIPGKTSKYTGAFYHGEENDDGVLKPAGNSIGVLTALNSFSNIRGFDASNVEYLVYDEFIPEKNARKIKEEGEALLNAFESINRNRELNGGKPLRLLAMSNSNTLDNPIFIDLGLVKVAMEMKKQHQEVRAIKDRGILIIYIQDSPISEAKADTALYRMAGRKSKFAGMALDNEFVSDDPSKIISRPLKEYRPIVRVGEITIYKHKSKELFYVSAHHAGGCPAYTSGDTSCKRFEKKYLHLWRAYLRDKFEFEEYVCELLLTRYFNR